MATATTTATRTTKLYRVSFRATCPDCLTIASQRCTTCRGFGKVPLDVFLPAVSRDDAETIGGRIGEVLIATEAHVDNRRGYTAADRARFLADDQHDGLCQSAIAHGAIADLYRWEAGSIR